MIIYSTSAEVEVAKRVPLTGKHGTGKTVLVTDCDYDWVSERRWSVSSQGYARTGPETADLLHRRIADQAGIDLDGGRQIDHTNRDKLDCRRSNLRAVTSAENNANRQKLKARNGNGYVRQKGVWAYTRRDGSVRYRAIISHHNRKHYLGVYDTADEAAAAYDAKAVELWGQYAHTNAEGAAADA